MNNLSNKKLNELILYVSERAGKQDPYFSKTKLNKILFYSDFMYYRQTGKAIVGATYIKDEHGPVLKDLKEVVKKKIDAKELAVKYERVRDYDRQVPVALREADLSMFDPKEISFIDEVINAISGYTAGTISDVSHKTIAWLAPSKLKEEIPYYLAHFKGIQQQAVSDDDVFNAKSLASKFAGKYGFAS